MFSEDAHKKAVIELMTYLRSISSQKNIAFFSDTSREYLRQLEKGNNIPTIRNLCGIIEAAGMELKEGLNLYVDMLRGEQKVSDSDTVKDFLK